MGRDDRLLTRDQVRRLYDRLAPGYDVVAGAYQLLGGRRLGPRALQLLGLRAGDTVVDLGCGTGVNLPHLARAVGPSGRVVGVDLSPGMLGQAKDRLPVDGGAPVELAQADLREYELPPDTRGVLATFALEMVPEYDDVVARVCRTLAATGGRLAVSGLRRPRGWPDWLVRLGVLVNRPFGVNRAYEDLHPWEAVRRHADEMAFETAMFGAVYLSVGAPGATAQRSTSSGTTA